MRRRCAGDNGVALVEVALVAPLLMWCFLGILEFGLVFRNSENTNSATRLTARSDTNLANYRSADWSALLALKAAVAKLTNAQVNYVIVYKGTQGNSSSPVPAACKTMADATSVSGVAGYGSSADRCNIFTRAQLAALTQNATTHFAASCAGATGGEWDRFWCPTDRKNGQLDNSGAGPDYLGIYLSVTYTSTTKIVPATITLTDTAVMRLEPIPGDD